MSRRRIRYAVGGLLAAGLLALIGAWSAAPSGPSRADVARIEKGMTPAEVEAILGSPTYVERPDDADPGFFSVIWEFPGAEVYEVYVGFTDGRVDVSACNVQPPFLIRLAQGVGLAP